MTSFAWRGRQPLTPTSCAAWFLETSDQVQRYEVREMYEEFVRRNR